MALTKKKLVIILAALAVVLCVLLVVAICLPNAGGKGPGLNLGDNSATQDIEDTTEPDATEESEGEGALFEEEGVTGPSVIVDVEGESDDENAPVVDNGEGDPFEGGQPQDPSQGGNTEEDPATTPTTQPADDDTQQETTEPEGSAESTGSTTPGNGEDDFVIDFEDLLKGQQ